MKKITVSILVITAIAVGVYISNTNENIESSTTEKIKPSGIEQTAIKQTTANNQAPKSPQPTIGIAKFTQPITAPVSLPMPQFIADKVEPADQQSPVNKPQAHGHEHNSHQHGNRNPDFGVPRPPGEPKKAKLSQSNNAN